MIPIAVKIYKLLINDLSIAMETTTSKQASAGDLEVIFMIYVGIETKFIPGS